MTKSKQMFTTQWVSHAPIIAGKQVDYWDAATRGLSLRVSPGGTRAYYFIYRHGRIQRRMKLGSIGDITLANVREETNKHRAAVRSGKDPAYERKQANQGETFGELATLFIEKHSSKKKRADEYERIINKDLLPAWRTRKVVEISRRDVRRLTEAIVERGSPIMANRVQALASKMLQFAVDEEIIEQNPCFRLKKLGEERERKIHLRTPQEFRALWNAIEKESLLVQTIMKLLLLTGQRTGEVLSMKWQNVDLNEGLWTIPASDAKNGNQHQVPLASTPVALLSAWKKHLERRVARKKQESSDYVFARNWAGKPKQVENLQKAMARIRRSSKLAYRVHDLRRTVATHVAEAERSDELVERLLNHKRPKLGRTYNHSTWLEPLREALQRWDERITRLTSPSRVVKFRVKAG